jgi:hypothetical protein
MKHEITVWIPAMKRLDKYRLETNSFSHPQRISILLEQKEIAEIYVRDGEMELRGPNYDHDHTDVIWREDIIGWGEFDASERDHYIQEAIRRADASLKAQAGLTDQSPKGPRIKTMDDLTNRLQALFDDAQSASMSLDDVDLNREMAARLETLAEEFMAQFDQLEAKPDLGGWLAAHHDALGDEERAIGHAILAGLSELKPDSGPQPEM